MAEQLFASFLLDREQGLEIAIAAENVTEATSVTSTIQPLPASVPFLQGIMRLRDAVIPVLNLKKRMGLPGSAEYDEDAKIAVILLANQRFGLLFDDIKEVLRVDDSLLLPIQPALQSEDSLISELITLHDQHRTIEVLDLDRIFQNSDLLTNEHENGSLSPDATEQHTYSRYVVFTSGNREYGVPVENSRELTFVSEIDDMFKTGCLEGALQLRGHTIPVMNACALLNEGAAETVGPLSRILVMTTDALNFGMIIDEVIEILTVCDQKILHMPASEDLSVIGIYEPAPNRNIMLLDVANLVTSQLQLLESMAKIRTGDDTYEEESGDYSESKHLITENCYLIFSIEKYFAIELKNVREIIEHDMLMTIPGSQGYDARVLNLRGHVIPVVDLRMFYDYQEQLTEDNSSRLIICGAGEQMVALQVDRIVTIYKQETFHKTPSLNPQFQPKKDTLDRLIEFVGERGIKEHVLVINTKNLIRNHLKQSTAQTQPAAETIPSQTPQTDSSQGVQ